MTKQTPTIPAPTSTTDGSTDPHAISTKPSIGVVVIGRNEGERLKRCLRSLVGSVECMVYVDSGSTDGSAEFADSLGVEVITLDLDQPFTMARGRNAGWQHLAAQESPVEFVQFVIITVKHAQLTALSIKQLGDPDCYPGQADKA